MAKKISCEKCGSQNLKATRTTYPINHLEKQIQVQRVSSRMCLDCLTLMPTEAGKEKIGRAMIMITGLLSR